MISAEAGVTRGLADASERELRDTLADIENYARSALEDIQSLVRSLRAGPGIAAPEQVDEVVAAVAFRSVQEALSNVVRHAPGAACTVELHADGDVLVVRVRDDGPGKEDGVSGFGLRGMRERAYLAGGTVAWRNLPDRGFEVEALRLILALEPDVALLDVQMPGGNGLEVARRVLTEAKGTRIIMLTTFDLDEYVHEALTLGASGFLLKNAPPPEVLHAVRPVHAGHAMLAPEVTARLMYQFAPRRSQRRHAFADELLSEREVQVIRLVARGCSNQEIADELFLSLETVRTYLKRMFAKLDVHDRTHLAVLAYEAGLLHESR